MIFSERSKIDLNQIGITIDSGVRRFFSCLADGISESDYHSMPTSRSPELQAVLDSQANTHHERLENAIKLGRANDSFKVYRENL